MPVRTYQLRRIDTGALPVVGVAFCQCQCIFYGSVLVVSFKLRTAYFSKPYTATQAGSTVPAMLYSTGIVLSFTRIQKLMFNCINLMDDASGDTTAEKPPSKKGKTWSL